MKVNVGPYLWGGVGGIVATAVVGFTAFGWVTNGTYTRDIAETRHNAYVEALAPVCAAQFRGQQDAVAKVAALTKASSWERPDIIEKAGFAKLPGSSDQDRDLASACADIVTAPKKS